MTEYFDAVGRELRDLGLLDPHVHDRLREIELKLVHDVSICAQMPGFPEDLRDAIDLTIMGQGIYSTPPVRGFPEGDAEDLEDHSRKLRYLAGDLHTIFHEVAHRGLPWFSDSPLMPIGCLAADAEERREDTAAAFVLFMRLLPWLQAP